MAGWSTGTCPANGIDIHYRSSGGALPPLVALHGLLGSSACLMPLAQPLTAAFNVILPDARGHGATSAPPEGYRYGDLADDVAGFIAGLDLTPPVLLGHSMGGLTAAVLASRPAVKLSAVVLIEPTFLTPERQHEVTTSDVAADHRRALVRPGSELLAEARTRHPHRADDLLQSLVDARLATSPAALAVLNPPNPPFHDMVSRLRVPTLLIRGSNGIIPLETARALRALNPLLELQVIDGAGHGVPYDQPDVLAARTLAFLHALASRASRASDGLGSPASAM